MQSTSSISAFKRKASASMKVLLLMMVVAIVLAACGGANKGPDKKNNGVLTIVSSPNGDWTRNFNPFSPSPMDGTRGPIYETLLYFNRLDGSVKPWLASDYKVSSDAKTITFTARDGVKWTDGKDFTAGDILFSINYLKEHKDIDTNGLWKYIDSAEKDGDKNVVVHLKQAYSPIIWQLGGQTYIVPEHVWSSINDPAKVSNENPVGTGPFTLKSFTPQLITLTKNNNFWQPGKPEVQEVRYPAYNSGTNTSLVLSRGDLDYSGLFTPDIDKTYVKTDPEHHKYWFPPNNVVMLYLNLDKAPFNDVNVRKALSSAIDRQNIVEVAENNYAQIASPTGLVLPANDKFLNPAYKDTTFKMDTNQATQLLEQAGFKKGSDGIYAKDGKKLSFKLNVVSGWNDWVSSCQIMAENFKKIGVEATVNSLSFNAYIAALQSGDYDTAISWTSVGPTPYYLLNSLLNSQYAIKPAASNYGRWIDKETDQLLDKYATTSDEKTQQEALNDLQKIMVEKMPSIALFYGPYWYEYNTSRFTGWPDKDNTYAVPPPWSYPDNEMVLLNLKPVE